MRADLEKTGPTTEFTFWKKRGDLRLHKV